MEVGGADTARGFEVTLPISTFYKEDRDGWIAASNEDKKLLDIWSSVIVNYNSIGRGVR